MQTIYLKEFNAYAKKGITYIPVGTLEWHGHHLPIETDFLVAQRICEILSKKRPGYILPPIYLGTDRIRTAGGKLLVGMDKHLKKNLAGNLYYIEPRLFYRLMDKLTENLSKQGFKKIYVVTGHGGRKQIETLNKLAGKKGVKLVNPYKMIKETAHHADEYELSLFWACFPGEERKSRWAKIAASDDYVKYKGYDPRDKASLSIGRRMLKEIVKKFK
ncbi:MAG: creatininase family protein [Planctomycetes bacterium]|jgi:creatinine amidohydrolase|nr:creatininase family protein [Planctomycetota bacterium]